jgi:putative two-component system response regulator
MTLADVFDALINRRVYKDAMPFSEAYDIIVAESGRQFDPDVVMAFRSLFNEFQAIAARYSDSEDL